MLMIATAGRGAAGGAAATRVAAKIARAGARGAGAAAMRSTSFGAQFFAERHLRYNESRSYALANNQRPRAGFTVGTVSPKQPKQGHCRACASRVVKGGGY